MVSIIQLHYQCETLHAMHAMSQIARTYGPRISSCQGCLTTSQAIPLINVKQHHHPWSSPDSPRLAELKRHHQLHPRQTPSLYSQSSPPKASAFLPKDTFPLPPRHSTPPHHPPHPQTPHHPSHYVGTCMHRHHARHPRLLHLQDNPHHNNSPLNVKQVSAPLA